MQTRLIDELSVVGRRMRSATQLTVLAIIWLFFFLTAWGLSFGGPWFGLTPAILSLVFLGVSLLASIVFCLVSRNWFSDPRWLANQVESCYPELDSRLLTSLDQLNQENPGEIGFLQHLVVMQTINHSAQNRWDHVISPVKIFFSQMAAVLSFLLLLIGSLMIANGRQQIPLAETPEIPIVAGRMDGQNLPVKLLSVEPGNTEVEKGTTLTVLAKFESSVPEQAELVFEFAQGIEQETGVDFFRIPMSASFDDPVFAGQIENVRQPLTYWVEFDDQTSDRYYATVFEYPELEQLDFELDFPDFTGLPNRTINDGRRVSALAGTTITIKARLKQTGHIV